MAISTNLISGLSSGFDWRSMIDQLIEIEHRPVDLVENQKTEYEEKLEIFQSLNTSLLSFRTNADNLASAEAFNLFTTTLSTDSSAYSASDFFSVSTTSSAAPGAHTIEMSAASSIAEARKISSKSFDSYDTALALSGEFIINGRAVKIETTDDLNDIMTKINNLNSGANATEVTASILTVSADNYRLILTSDNTGEDAFTIFGAGSENILSSGLGFTDGTTTVKNLISNGAESEGFSSSSVSVASMLGLSTTPAPTGAVTIGSVAVTLDLSNSLTEIASDINDAAELTNITASVVSSTEDGVTTYKLKILNTTSFSDNNHVLETLGILEGDQADETEEHITDIANTTTSDPGPVGNVTAGTVWGYIDTGGDANNVTNSDTITFSGVNHIGQAVSGSYVINDKGTDTIGGLLTEIQDAFFDVNDDYQVTASIENGKIKIVDAVTGDSLLSLSVTVNNEGGGTLNLGTITASTEGYSMELQEGKDANIIIDGTAIVSSSNIIDDAISGVTLNLLAVESGSTVNLSVSRDYDSILSSVQDLIDSYNEVITAINEQSYYDEEAQSAGPLQGDATLSSIKFDLVDILTQAITGLPSDLNRLSLVGINSVINYSDHSTDGTLTLDEDTFLDVFNDNFLGLKRVFVAEGSADDADVQYVTHSNDTVPGTYAVYISQAATQATVTGSTVLTSGIGATSVETLTVSQGDKIASVILNGASGENGSSIDNIVNAINSEMDAEYSQSIMGDVKNTTDEAGTTAITSATTWSAIWGAGLLDDMEITFLGHKRDGTSVSGTYAIDDADVDTVQGFLSSIESAYDNDVSASINTYGYLVISDNTTGASELDIDITAPGSLNFGAVTTSNLVSDVRNTKNSGADAITETDTWGDLDGQTLAGEEVIKFAGYKSDGTAVEGSYTVDLGHQLSQFLTAIETSYGGSVNASFQDGGLVLTDGTTNTTLGITIFEPSGSGVDFGTISGGVTGRYAMDLTASKDGSDHLVLTHDDYGSAASFSLSQSGADLGLGAVTAGLDVDGTINEEAATGAGQILTGDAPVDDDDETSVEGLVIKYTGTGTGPQGNVTITMGAGELFSRAIYDITNTIDGYLDYRLESMTERIDDFEDQIADMEARLDLKMGNMINQFVAMELALSKIQNMSSWLSGQINAASGAWS